MSTRVLRHEQATSRNVLSALDVDELYFSCHGRFDSQDPSRSALFMAHDDVLNLPQILEMRLPKAPVVILGACETALTDHTDVLDELEGLHTAFLLAGARVVVGSLWSVSDFSTSLLLARLHGRIWRRRTRVSEALAFAQRWLRDLTATSAHRIVNRMERQGVQQQHVESAHRLIDDLSSQHGTPFRHPYWWAAFQAVGGPAS